MCARVRTSSGDATSCCTRSHDHASSNQKSCTIPGTRITIARSKNSQHATSGKRTRRLLRGQHAIDAHPRNHSGRVPERTKVDEALWVGIGPFFLDREPRELLRTHVETAVAVFTRDKQELDLPPAKIGEPGLEVRLRAVPLRPRIPGRGPRRPGTVIVVGQPVEMGIDVDVLDLVPQADPEEV